MKTVIAILLLSVLGIHRAEAQAATSSKKNAQMQQSQEPTLPVSNASSATLVSGGKDATIKETPVDTKETPDNKSPATGVATPSSKKPE